MARGEAFMAGLFRGSINFHQSTLDIAMTFYAIRSKDFMNFCEEKLNINPKYRIGTYSAPILFSS